MTEDNRRRNLADEVTRAEQARRAAETLLEHGLHADSVSRAYYALFHWLRALLMSRGLDPKSHRGAIHLFNHEFVRTGLLSSAHNRLLAELQRSREFADYDAAVTFSADDARQILADAGAFETAARELLRSEGWIGSD